MFHINSMGIMGVMSSLTRPGQAFRGTSGPDLQQAWSDLPQRAVVAFGGGMLQVLLNQRYLEAKSAMIEIKANLETPDYTKFRLFSMFRLRRMWLLYAAFVALSCWLFFPSDYQARQIPLAVALASPLVISLVDVAMVLLATFIVLAFLPNRTGTVLGEHRFTLTDTEFQETNRAGLATARLDGLRRYETAEHVFLLTPSHTGYILPLRDLRTDPEFLKELRERTKGGS